MPVLEGRWRTHWWYISMHWRNACTPRVTQKRFYPRLRQINSRCNSLHLRGNYIIIPYTCLLKGSIYWNAHIIGLQLRDSLRNKQPVDYTCIGETQLEPTTSRAQFWREFQIYALIDTQPPLLLTTIPTVRNMQSCRKMLVSSVNRGWYRKINMAVKGWDKSNRNVTSG